MTETVAAMNAWLGELGPRECLLWASASVATFVGCWTAVTGGVL